jgi:hypothetical protein
MDELHDKANKSIDFTLYWNPTSEPATITQIIELLEKK